MRPIKLLFVALPLAVAVVSESASAATLLEVTDTGFISQSSPKPFSLQFTAGSSATTISFAGYNANGIERVSAIDLFSVDPNANLLTHDPNTGLVFDKSGTNPFSIENASGLRFDTRGYATYDTTFSRRVSTDVGTLYTLNFNFTSQSSGNGLQVVASDIAGPSVPEPATWALMLLGFGMIGFAMRKRSNVRTTVSYA